MLSSRDIVVFSYTDWFSTGSTPQHMTRLLAEQNRVLYVDMPRSFLRAFKGKDPQKAGEWSGPRLREVEPNIFVYHPPHCFLPVGELPYQPARAALLANGLLLARLVRRACRELNMRDVLLWNFSPMHGGAIHHVPHALLIHDIADEWSNYIHYAAGRRLVDWMDCKLTREADVAFVFSRHMLERRAGLNPETHIVPPAGDVPFYARALDESLEVPEDLAALPRPIVGAICVIDASRFDVGLIEHLGRCRPEWSIAIVGPVRKEVDLSALDGFPNIHIMGDRDRTLLPAYLKGFDVCMVPYALNDATRGIYPMKIQEYLAAGKGVVSPALPECMHLEPMVRFGASHELFASELEDLLLHDTQAAREARIQTARQNTWRHRLEDRSRHLERVLAGKSAQ